MRRIVTRALPAVGLRTALTAAVPVGVPATPVEVAKAAGLTEKIAPEALKPVDAAWTAVNSVGRARLGALAATYNGEDLCGLRADVAANPPKQAIKGAKQVFRTKGAQSLVTLCRFYEEVIYPILQLRVTIEATELEGHGLNDNLKLGLAAFTQQQLDEKTKRLGEVQKLLAEQRAATKALVEDAFDTAIVNDLVNALRIAGEKDPEALEYAQRILDDVSSFGIVFDDVTKMLLKNVVFGDGPYEDSGLLFSFVEYPERGEISVSNNKLENISDEAMKTISKRHQTPLTEGTLLRLGDTHPNLQRSLE